MSDNLKRLDAKGITMASKILKLEKEYKGVSNAGPKISKKILNIILTELQSKTKRS